MASGTVVESDLAGPALSLTEGEEERLLDSDREDNTAQSVSFLLFKEFSLGHRSFFHTFSVYNQTLFLSLCISQETFLSNPVNLRRTRPSELVYRVFKLALSYFKLTLF